MAGDELETYLTDHLAGAGSGVDLARRVAEMAQGTAAGPALREVAEAVEADRQVLADLVDRLGSGQRALKQAAAWAAEKASRLRLNRASAGSAELALLMSMEALSAGVEGKRALWQALQAAAPDEPAVAGLDLEALEERAAAQLDALEAQRRALAPAAIGRG